MNQLTVMINGNAANGQANTLQPASNGSQQYFTFQPGLQTLPGHAITLEQPNANQQLLQPQQLVSFQPQQPPQQQHQTQQFQNNLQGTLMLAGNSQPYATQSCMNQQGAIQYIITPSLVPQQQQQTNQQILTTAQPQQTFGLMPNLMNSGVNMIPVNQPLQSANGTIIQSQLMPSGASLQPTFVAMGSNQPTGTFHIQTSANTNGSTTGALFHQQSQQFQLIGSNSSMANSAIINPNSQLIASQSGQPQFILQNQNLTPNNATANMISSHTNQSQQLYQIMLPNGQVIQTVQPSQNLISQPTIAQQQPTAITVPIPNNQGQLNTAILGSNLALSGQTFIAAPNQPQAVSHSVQANSQMTTIIGSQHSPLTANMFNTPMSGSNIREQGSLLSLASQNSLVISPTSATMTTSAASLSQSLLLSSNNSLNTNGQLQLLSSASRSPVSNTSTTAMMVLTQSMPPVCSTTTSSSSSTFQSSNLIPNTVLDHKSIKSQSSIGVNTLASPVVEKYCNQAAMSSMSSQTVANSEVALSKLSSDCAAQTKATSFRPPSGVASTPRNHSKLISECLKKPYLPSQNESVNVQNEIGKSDNFEKVPTRPPSSASSCGSLKIAEDETNADEMGEKDQFDEDTEATENYTCSTATEMDVESPATEQENEGAVEHEKPMSELQSSIGDTIECQQDPVLKHKQEEKEGYQSSYGGSPCHFTDTEDEEEEEDEEDGENDACDNLEQTGEIKLVRRNGLTKAAYNLINNRILSSEDDNATSASFDSKCSSTSMVNEEVAAFNDESKTCFSDGCLENKDKVSTQTLDAPSPLSVHSNTSMEPESTTQNALISSSKEKTIINTDVRIIDGVNLDEIKEFAKSFKLCRLSLGLTQSQVGHELSALNGPCYSQSAICRFEKLDITPKSAKKIKPVLENWMREAEEKYLKSKLTSGVDGLPNGVTNKENNGSFFKMNGLDMVNNNGSALVKAQKDSISSLNISFEPGKKRKRRTSFTPAAIDALNHFFEKNQHPNSSEMTEISEILNYERDVVRVWFCNKRQALRAKKQQCIETIPEGREKSLPVSTTGQPKIFNMTQPPSLNNDFHLHTNIAALKAKSQTLSSLVTSNVTSSIPYLVTPTPVLGSIKHQTTTLVTSSSAFKPLVSMAEPSVQVSQSSSPFVLASKSNTSNAQTTGQLAKP